MQNRLGTAMTFGILASEVFKMLEEVVFNFDQPSDYGVLSNLLIKVGIIILIG